MVGNGVGEGGVVLRSLGQRGTVSEERRLELANTLVILIGAQCATFEDLFGEGCAMFCFTVPCVYEMANGVCKLSVCARVPEVCQGVYCQVCHGGVCLVSYFAT